MSRVISHTFCKRGSVVDIPLSCFDHDGNGQRVPKIRMIFVGLDERMVFRQKVRKNGLELDAFQAPCKEQGGHE